MKKNVILRILIFVIISFTTIISLISFSKNQVKNENFMGVVKEVRYDAHENPEVKFKNGRNINLLLFSFGSDYKSIKEGDSLFKKKGKVFLLHYKKNINNKYYLYRKYNY